MSGGAVTGLLGKLPAHGDFVRRGGPIPVLAALDRWLDVELSRAPELIEALDGWRFAVRVEGQAVLGTIVASEDAVGRRFPVLAIADVVPDAETAERWCADAAAALLASREASAALAALPPAPVDPGEAAGWWHPDGRAGSGEATLPAGERFAALFAQDPS